MLRFHKLRVAAVRRETRDAVVVHFEVPDALREQYRFVQGQHLALRASIDGQELRRTYSICSGVGDGVLRVAIKRQPGGRFSGFANERLAPGQTLDVMTPTGSFHTPLDPARAGRYVAFAAGSGITPVLSIIRTTLAVEAHSDLVLFYGNRSKASIMFREELEDLKNMHLQRFALHHLLSREHREHALYNGRIDGSKVHALLPLLPKRDSIDAWFLCGPASMIDEASGALRAAGVDPARIHFERFTTDAAAPARRAAPRPASIAPDEQCAVTVLIDGARSEFEMAFDADSVLDAALSRGIELPFSCKGGVCTTCRAKLVEGEVDLAVNYGLEPHELDAGFVLTCQSRPLSRTLKLDFDATG